MFGNAMVAIAPGGLRDSANDLALSRGIRRASGPWGCRQAAPTRLRGWMWRPGRSWHVPRAEMSTMRPDAMMRLDAMTLLEVNGALLARPLL